MTDTSATSALPFTGERYVPELKGGIALEHVHRYVLCAGLARGRRVLDLACGEGYGANLLAQTAASVTGVDVDAATIRHAEAKYRATRNLSFRAGDCRKVPLEASSVDLVVSFETIEHLAEQDEMLAEIKRVLAPAGLLVISSPDRRVYNEQNVEANEFHVRELSRTEFFDLLSRHFKAVQLYGQRQAIGSFIVPDTVRDDQGLRAYMRGPGGTDEGVTTLPDAIFHVAVCGDDAATLPTLAPSVHLDPHDDMVREQTDALRQQGDVMRKQISVMAEQQQEIERRGYEIETGVGKQLAEVTAELERHRTVLGNLTRDHHQMVQSISWRVTQPLRWLNRLARTVLGRSPSSNQ